MNLLLFIMIIIVSFIVVRIGAIAFQLTGLEWSLAKFQALSCFTGTGFTTKEAELITGHPQRRRIATVLIVLGHAGLVTLIATFANSLRTDAVMTKMTIPFLHSAFPPALRPWINLLILAFAVLTTYKILTNSRFVTKLTSVLRSQIIKKEFVKRVSFEELLIATGGYGVSSAEVTKESSILDKTILESELRKHDITILVIERNNETIPNPAANIRIRLGDRLICFGKLETIRRELSSRA
ncbi:cation:proton antiporter regulatory subunit [Candidatus Omnitrophota bacterium]